MTVVLLSFDRVFSLRWSLFGHETARFNDVCWRSAARSPNAITMGTLTWSNKLISETSGRM